MWLRADRDRFNAIGLQWRAYTQADPLLNPEDKEQARKLIEDWDRDLQAWGGPR